jgi:hypothetical protein
MTHTIKIIRKGVEKTTTGTVEELISYFQYTLEVGAAYAHEKGNKKINQTPKTAKSLVNELNKAKCNAAANGCPDTYYELG